jgi:hypothetical protein
MRMASGIYTALEIARICGYKDKKAVLFHLRNEPYLTLMRRGGPARAWHINQFPPRLARRFESKRPLVTKDSEPPKAGILCPIKGRKRKGLREAFFIRKGIVTFRKGARLNCYDLMVLFQKLV